MERKSLRLWFLTEWARLSHEIPWRHFEDWMNHNATFPEAKIILVKTGRSRIRQYRAGSVVTWNYLVTDRTFVSIVHFIKWITGNKRWPRELLSGDAAATVIYKHREAKSVRRPWVTVRHCFRSEQIITKIKHLSFLVLVERAVLAAPSSWQNLLITSIIITTAHYNKHRNKR